MNRHTHMLPVLSMAAAALLAATAASAGANNDENNDEENEIPFDEASLFFELNDTDGDLGIHGLIDGDAWKHLEIEDPRERTILDVQVRSSLRKQGLTEVFFESAEPTFDELPPEKFFRRFPEGEYEIGGRTLEGEELESTAVLSHVMPAPAGNIMISGVAAAENCDAEPLPSVSDPVIISWDPVTQSHPQIGKSGAIKVVKYEVVVEREEPSLLVLSVDLPPEVTEFEIPSAFIGLGEAFKFEIIARTASGNQTATESCFEIQ